MTTGNSPKATVHPSLAGLVGGPALPVGTGSRPLTVGAGKGADAPAGFLGTTYNPFIVEGLWAANLISNSKAK